MDILQIRKFITSTISTIAGIINFEKLTEENNIEEENDGIIINVDKNNPQVVNITMGLIILSNISAINVVEEIYQILIYHLKYTPYSLGSLCIYIKGTR